MAKAKKLPSGNWRVNQYVGKDDAGKRIYKSFTASTKKEAEYMAAEYALNQKLSDQPDKMTLEEAMERYIEMKNNVLSPSTLNGYKCIQRNSFLDIQQLALPNLSNNIIQRSINKEAARLSSKSVHNASGFLSAVLAQFYPSFHYHVTLPAKQKKMKELIDPETLLTVIKGTNVELPVLLAAWLSYRMSEIRGLKKSDIKDGYITVRRANLRINSQDILRENTKTTGSTRKAKIPEYILNLIEQLPSEQEFLVPEIPKTITHRFQTLLKHNNLPHMTFHDLRHMNASVMAMLGIQDKYAMERGGWSSPQIMQNVYQHTFSEERKKVDEKIDTYFENIMQHEMQHEKKEAAI